MSRVMACRRSSGARGHGVRLSISSSRCATEPRRPIETPEGRDPYPPGPTGSILGDTLALVISCAVAAVRWHGRAEAELEALIGRFDLAAALAPGS
jgi:hypothetical protein